MSALLESAVVIEKGNIWVGDDAGSLVDLGAVRKVMFTGKMNKQQINSDNRGTIKNHTRINGEISFDWLEPGSVSNMENLFKGAVTKSTVPGSSTPVTGEVTASGSWSYLKVILFAKQNGDFSKPTSISVSAGTDGALVEDTDFFVVQDPATKKWGYYVKDSATVTTQSQSLTAGYTVTPNASLKLTGGTSLTQTARYIKIVGPSESDSNVTRTLELASATASSDMVIPFVDVETANDVAVMPVKLESDKGTTWTWTDEVNPN